MTAGLTGDVGAIEGTRSQDVARLCTWIRDTLLGLAQRDVPEEEIWGSSRRAPAGLPAATGSRVLVHPAGSADCFARASCLT